MIDSIMFDLDGTLWDPRSETLNAVNKVAQMYNIEKINPSTIKSAMGHTDEEVMNIYMPDLDNKKQKEIFKKMNKLKNDYLSNYGCNIYPFVQETLVSLSKKYKLFIISNCGAGYIESFLDHYDFNDLFTDFIAASKENISKNNAMKKLMKKYNLKRPIYVGDRSSDYNYAKAADVPFVHAKYGYEPELKTDYRIERFDMLPNCIDLINKNL